VGAGISIALSNWNALTARRLSIPVFDLGLKDLATLSNGDKIEIPQFYRKSEERLATAQRARKNPEASTHNSRQDRLSAQDFLHKASTKLCLGDLKACCRHA